MKAIINLLLVLILICFFYKEDIKDNFSSLIERKNDLKSMLNSYIENEQLNNVNNDINVDEIIEDENDIGTIKENQLEQMGKHFDINYKFSSHLDNEINDIDYKIDTIGDYLIGVSEDPGRYIQRDYVQNALDYQMDKISMDKHNLQKNLVRQNEFEDFSNINGYNSFQGDMIPIPEEEDIILYPKRPEDFYGDYEIIDGQYLILNKMKINLTPTRIIIRNVDDVEILNYELEDINSLDTPRFPLTTIEISLNTSLMKTDNKVVLDVPTQILAQKQRNLLYKLGFNSGILYLFGSDAKYRIYNNNRTLIFHLKRLTTTLI